MSEYIALIHKDADSDYGVSFPDLPGCVTAGRTLEEARELAPEALALHIAGIIEDGEAIPAPSSLTEIMEDRANLDAVALVVPAPKQSVKSVRVNITLPEATLEEIDAYAAREGFTRSGFIARAAKKVIHEAA
jgi:predicted RNase H-like HicB family nuclease